MKNKTNTAEVQPMWLYRETTGRSSTVRGKEKCVVTQELVWGHRQEINKRFLVVGDAFLTLSGPTAKASICSLAEQYNLTGKHPPELRPKCVADGGRLPKDGGPNQDIMRLTLQPRNA